jgi:hypothetical protein
MGSFRLFARRAWKNFSGVWGEQYGSSPEWLLNVRTKGILRTWLVHDFPKI